jgi:hypothetical protein
MKSLVVLLVVIAIAVRATDGEPLVLEVFGLKITMDIRIEGENP